MTLHLRVFHMPAGSRTERGVWGSAPRCNVALRYESDLCSNYEENLRNILCVEFIEKSNCIFQSLFSHMKKLKTHEEIHLTPYEINNLSGRSKSWLMIDKINDDRFYQ